MEPCWTNEGSRRTAAKGLIFEIVSLPKHQSIFFSLSLSFMILRSTSSSCVWIGLNPGICPLWPVIKEGTSWLHHHPSQFWVDVLNLTSLTSLETTRRRLPRQGNTLSNQGCVCVSLFEKKSGSQLVTDLGYIPTRHHPAVSRSHRQTCFEWQFGVLVIIAKTYSTHSLSKSHIHTYSLDLPRELRSW